MTSIVKRCHVGVSTGPHNCADTLDLDTNLMSAPSEHC